MLPLEKAYYRAKAKSWDLGTAETGTDQVAVEFEVVEGEQKGARITWYGFFTEKTEERTFEALRICGWTGTDLSDLTGLDANVVELACEPEDSQPNPETGEIKTRLRVRWVNRSGGIVMKNRMDEDKKKVLAAKMKARLAAFDAKARAEGRQSAPPPVRPPPANGGPPPGHPAAIDDIPF